MEEENENFIFTFLPVANTKNTYNLKINDKYINANEGWRLRLGTNTSTNGRIKLAKQNDCIYSMQGAWTTVDRYFNFDVTTAGSYVYADKTSDAFWQIEKVKKESSIPVAEATGISVFPTFSKGEITVITPSESVIRILDISGQILDIYQSSGKITIKLSYPDGMYFVAVNNGKEVVYKVFLKS